MDRKIALPRAAAAALAAITAVAVGAGRGVAVGRGTKVGVAGGRVAVAGGAGLGVGENGTAVGVAGNGVGEADTTVAETALVAGCWPVVAGVVDTTLCVVCVEETLVADDCVDIATEATCAVVADVATATGVAAAVLIVEARDVPVPVVTPTAEDPQAVSSNTPTATEAIQLKRRGSLYCNLMCTVSHSSAATRRERLSARTYSTAAWRHVPN